MVHGNPFSSRSATTLFRWFIIKVMTSFRIRIILVTLLCALGLPAWASTLTPRIHHDLRISVDTQKGHLHGLDTITFDSSLPELPPVLLPSSITVEEIRVNGKVRPDKPDDRVLKLSNSGAEGGKTILSIRYHATFQDAAPANPLHTEDPTFGVAGTITPRGTFLGADAGWYPHVADLPVFFTLHFDAPEGTTAVAAGRLVEHYTSNGRTTTVWATEQPLPALSLSAGPYRMARTDVEGIPVYTFFYQETGELARTYLEAATRYLTLYQELFGPYPFEKFAVVENFFPTGYGFPSWTLLGSSVVRLPFIVETSLGHEIAHSWWGTSVQVDSIEGNWAEGLTTYVADHLYKEQQSPADGRSYRYKVLRDYASLVNNDNEFPVNRFVRRYDKASQSIGYGKAAMIFHMARQQVGEEAFWRALKKVYHSKRFARASWNDFARHLGTEANQNLAPFFEQWLVRTGAPSLALDNMALQKVEAGWQVEGEIVQAAPIYDLRVPYRIETPAGHVEGALDSRSGRTPFKVTTQKRPSRLLLDPYFDLFRRLAPSEVPPSVNTLRASRSLIVILAAPHSSALREAAEQLLAALRQENVPILSEHEVDRFPLQDYDLLIVGMPQRAQLRPPLLREVEIGATSFDIEQQSFPRDSHTLLAVSDHPLAEGHMATWLLAPSPDRLRPAIRKIPHYGQYGLLVFEQATNRYKGVWPVTESPTIFEFSKER